MTIYGERKRRRPTPSPRVKRGLGCQARPSCRDLVIGVLALASIGLWTASVSAAKEAPDPAASFFVESIRVEGLGDASERMLRAASRLEPGNEYSELALEEAIARLQRLTFVYDARFGLERGSRRDAYVLVIEVDEVHRFFFGLSAEAVAIDGGVFLGSPSARPASLTDSETGLAVNVGVRHFVGTSGVAFAAAGDQGLEVGYTHHDILGRGGFVGVSVAARDFEDRVFPLSLDPGFMAWNLEDALQLRIDGGVPLSGRHTLRFGVELLTDGTGQRNALFGSSFPGVVAAESALEVDRARHLRLDARWVADTTDDPTLPTRGYAVQGGVAYQTLESEQTMVAFSPEGAQRTPLSDYRATATEAFAGGLRHWPLSQRQTVSLGVVARVGRSQIEGQVAGSAATLDEHDLTTFAVSASTRYSIALRNPRRRSDRGDLRFEVRAGYAYESTSPSLGFAGNPLERRELGIAVVQRTAWGILRFGLTFLDLGESVQPRPRIR